MSNNVFLPPSDWPDTITESELAELAERAEGLQPRSVEAQAILVEATELLWLAQQTEIASRLAVWRAQGYRPSLLNGVAGGPAVAKPSIAIKGKRGSAAS